ncbi:MAG: nucleotide sugar dehydrogenase, partial [Bacteroidetes bacterium]|nr:nucleotide sugar dehydrogenase [Bacteroidota bacterium]
MDSLETTGRISVNPASKKVYALPDILSDKKAIDAFLNSNVGKQVVVVQGLGFVGAVMSLVCANALNAEYSVIGVDLANENTFWKIRGINEGVFPIIASDPDIEKFYRAALKKRNLMATFDPYAYSAADVIIVDINLDVNKTSGYDKELLSYNVD